VPPLCAAAAPAWLSHNTGLLLNSILVVQCLVYGNKGVAVQKPKGKKAAAKKAA
jgi:hypothetical protein